MSCNFKDVLEQYLQLHEEPVGNHGTLPFRLPNYVIKEEEFNGECIDLTFNHLITNSFPDILASALTHAVVETIQSQDLSPAVKRQDAQVKSYETVKIAQILFSLVHSLCKDWILNLPSHLLSHAKSIKHSQCGIKNTRRKMEDKHIVMTNLNVLLGLENTPIIQWYAVYDGHGGLDASSYAAKQLHLNFVKEDEFLVDISESLKRSIRKTDEEFCIKSQNERLRSGTTAVVAVIIEQTLHVAWVGDSQALLVKNGEPITIMNPHKPDRPDEKQRIEDMGGCVVWFGAWRVNGTLSVSRAIGDAEHKPFICGDADTFSVALDGNEDFLCLACDGFWDVFNGNDLVKLVREHLREGKSRETVAEFLCMKAKAEGSTDNITVVLVFLRDDIDMGDEQVNQSAAEANRMSNWKPDSSFNDNENNNNSRIKNVEQSPDETSDGLSIIQGQQLDLEEKQKIPHKLLVNFVRNTNQKKIEKEVVIVTSSSSHAKLPHSIRNLRLGRKKKLFKKPKSGLISKIFYSHHHSLSTLTRADMRESLLSLSTVSIVSQLPAGKAKRELDKNNNNSTDLPCINTGKPLPRRSTIAPSCGYFEVQKPLGHRAPNIHTRVRERVPYHTSVVATFGRETSWPMSSRRGKAASLLEDALARDENGRTKYAITNGLAPSLKLRQEKVEKKRQILKLIHRNQGRRSQSLF